MADGDARFRDDFSKAGDDPLDVVHAVVHEIHLPAALQFAVDGLAQQFIVPLQDVGADGLALFGRRHDGAHVADANQRHLQRARDGRCGKDEAVDFRAHLLQALFVRNAEALLLVDDDEAEILEGYVFLDKPVCADGDIDFARGDSLDDFALLLLVAEAGEHFHAHGEAGDTFPEGVAVLFREDGGGHEDSDLLAVHYGFERGAHCDFGLAIADVSANEAVHRLLVLHVRFDFRDCLQLVLRFDEGEGRFHLHLPGVVGLKSVPAGHLPPRVQVEQLLREFDHGLLHAPLCPRPILRAEPRQ